MFAHPFPNEYNNTINTIGQPYAQPAPPPPSHPPPVQPLPVLVSPDDLPAHPIVQQYLLNSQPSLPPPSLSSSSSPPAALSNPKPSDFFIHPSQDRPYFIFCLSCSSPLSDVFHVTDGDDTHVTVDSVYSDSVLSAHQPTVVAEQGLFYALSCHRCGSPIGRYYRFTSPGAINKCNMFSLDVQCVGVKLLGSATVKGEQYVEETGIATRLTQVMLTTAAVREEMDEVKVEGRRMRDELDKARATLRRMEMKLRQLTGEVEEDDDDVVEVAMNRKTADITTPATAISGIATTTAASAAASSSASATPRAKRYSLPSSTPQSTVSGQKRGRPSQAALGALSNGEDEKKKEDEDTAFVPAVKRKGKVAAGSRADGRSVEAAGRDETEDEMDSGDDKKQMQRPQSVTNGAKQGRSRKVTLAPPR